jgi:hypothetical protein
MVSQPDKAFRLGRVAGLDLSIQPSALWSMAAVWLGLSAASFWLLGFDLASPSTGCRNSGTRSGTSSPRGAPATQ